MNSIPALIGQGGHRRVAIAGSTGSIGTQSLDVLSAARETYELVAIGASGRNLDALINQARDHRPKVVAVSTEDPAVARELRSALPQCEIRAGRDALSSFAEEADIVVNALVGFAGLGVTLATLEAGRRLALANKESLVAAGPVVQRARQTPGAELLPVDSEHAALHLCLRGVPEGRFVRRLILTASGGPLRGRTKAELSEVTLAEALAHPTWSMGPKITVDSSTLVNKGLEVIEAHELFGSPAGEFGCGVGLDDIEVVVHPQSIIHSMVELCDGATLAQLSMPDMKLPIGAALAHPGHLQIPHGEIDWCRIGHLDFEPPDRDAFPCLDLAYAAGRTGGSAPAWFNAANEVAVAAFLEERIRWIDISAVLAGVLDKHDGSKLDDVGSVLDADAAARSLAEALINRRER